MYLLTIHKIQQFIIKYNTINFTDYIPYQIFNPKIYKTLLMYTISFYKLMNPKNYILFRIHLLLLYYFSQGLVFKYSINSSFNSSFFKANSIVASKNPSLSPTSYLLPSKLYAYIASLPIKVFNASVN